MIITRVIDANMESGKRPKVGEADHKALLREDALAAYQRLKHRGIRPGINVVVGALKVCRSLKDLELGRRIHNDVVETGDFASNIIVANILLDLYAKSGGMADARAAFDSMEQRDIVSWNSIIQGYAHNGDCDLALSFFARLEDDAGIKPDRVSVLGALKACSGLIPKGAARALERSREVHRRAAEIGLDSDLFIASSLVDLYAKCGDLEEARRVFEGMSYRSVVSWNCMILGYASKGDGDEALEIYARMRRGSALPDAVTLVAAIKACCCLAEREQGSLGSHGGVVKLRSLQIGRGIHSEAGEHCSHTVLANALVDFYARCGSMAESRSVFDGIRRPDSVSWNSIILGYARNDQEDLALEQFFRMKDECCCAPDRVSVLAALKACVNLAGKDQNVDGSVVKVRAFAQGKSVHARALGFMDKEDLVVANALVDMYAKCGSIVDAWLVFQDMAVRDVISWTGILLGYAYSGQWKLVLDLFQSMQDEDVSVDQITITTAVKAVAALAESADRKLAKSKLLAKGRALHRQLGEVCEVDAFVASVLVDMYRNCGSMEDARQVFDSIRDRDLVLWNSMILGYADCGEAERALELYEKLQQDQSLEPNAMTYAAALKACSSLAALELGKRIHVRACNSGFDTESSVGSSLVSFYGRCGSMIEAEEAFAAITSKTVVAWSALMAGYSSQGDSRRVFELFDAMQRDRVRPDGVTFVSVLTACSHAGLIDRGRDYFEAMRSRYGVTPNTQHYTCLIDLLCRANQLEEALRILKSMPCEADGVLWTALLSSCLKWRDLDAGKMAFESVLGLDERTGSAYSLMSNIYARSDQSEVRG